MEFVIKLAGCLGGECFLIGGASKAILLDSGFGFCADGMIEKLERALNGRTLEAVLLSHSHYDHVTGSAAVRRRFPHVKVISSEHAQNILVRPNARALIRDLDNDAAQAAGWPAADPSLFDELSVDLAMKDGQTLTIADFSVQAVATPGHTRCCISYFFPQQGLLYASETVGVTPYFPQVVPNFITSYRDTMGSLAKSIALGATQLIPSHSQLFTGTDVAVFWDLARRRNEAAAQLILDQFERGKSLEEMVAAYGKMFYIGEYRVLHPESAFLINTRAMITRFLQECGKIDVA